ncbi:hypothetical protein SynA1528_02114 [Synechococcus sp. A15-28]|nr:hypothetical protein SynA1528_02114 [Synechococcus sp. A15-28]
MWPEAAPTGSVSGVAAVINLNKCVFHRLCSAELFALPTSNPSTP